MRFKTCLPTTHHMPCVQCCVGAIDASKETPAFVGLSSGEKVRCKSKRLVPLPGLLAVLHVCKPARFRPLQPAAPQHVCTGLLIAGERHRQCAVRKRRGGRPQARLCNSLPGGLLNQPGCVHQQRKPVYWIAAAATRQEQAAQVVQALMHL